MSTTIAVDLAKSVFEVAASDTPGQVTTHRRLTRVQFARFLRTHPPATVLLEACGSAHFWGREAEAAGHQVRLLPPHAVRPYVPRNKTDRADAKGLLEAARNEAIHPVPVKSVHHQTLTALHRLRTTWLATRTARLNTIRGLVREFGVTIPLGAHQVARHVPPLLAVRGGPIPAPLAPVLTATLAEIATLETQIRTVEQQLTTLAADLPIVAQLRTVPGIGLLTATALVASVSDITRFPSGRHFASYLGLTPRERSSGGHRRLGAISKRGDAYLRMLFVHGARSVLCHAKTISRPLRLQTWALAVQRHRGHNKAAVALANKLARIVWAVWRTGQPFAA